MQTAIAASASRRAISGLGLTGNQSSGSRTLPAHRARCRSPRPTATGRPVARRAQRQLASQRSLSSGRSLPSGLGEAGHHAGPAGAARPGAAGRAADPQTWGGSVFIMPTPSARDEQVRPRENPQPAPGPGLLGARGAAAQARAPGRPLPTAARRPPGLGGQADARGPAPGRPTQASSSSYLVVPDTHFGR